MAEVRVTGTADEIELTARSLGAAPRMQRRRDGMMAGYFEVHAPKVICLDLGTTGPNPVEGEIVAIAIVGWAGNVLHEGKYRPSRKELWQAASEVNGVSPDDQIDLPSFFDDQAKIRDIICGADEVIVYDAPRVMRFMEYNDAAPSSGTRVTDAMYELPQARNSEPRSQLPRAHRVGRHRGSNRICLGKQSARYRDKCPRLPRCPKMD